MIFALYDFFQYKSRSGRYSRNVHNGAMSAAWENGIPEHVLNLLEDGDLLLFQTFDSIGSWMIMYGSSSHVSHVGHYLNGKRIAHMIPPELTIEPISNHFKENIRILPSKIKKTKDYDFEAWLNSIENKKYGYLTVIRKAFSIITGRHSHYFRWKFFADIALALIILDIPLFWLFNHPVISILIPFHAFWILFNKIIWKYKPLNPFEHGAPVEALFLIQISDGVLLGDAFAISDQEHGHPIYRHSPTHKCPTSAPYTENEECPKQGIVINN